MQMLYTRCAGLDVRLAAHLQHRPNIRRIRVHNMPVTSGSSSARRRVRTIRESQPASSAPTIGATQKSQSCPSAQSPTNSAGPVLRAGFTEVFVTGMLTRWMRVSASPIAMPAKPTGARR